MNYSTEIINVQFNSHSAAVASAVGVVVHHVHRHSPHHVCHCPPRPLFLLSSMFLVSSFSVDYPVNRVSTVKDKRKRKKTYKYPGLNASRAPAL